MGKKELSTYLLILVGLSILIALLRLPSLYEPLEGVSGAIAYHARLILNGEPLYGSHHPSHHLPAAFYTYALAFFLMGDNPLSIKFLLIPWTIATALLIYMIGKRLEKKMTGLLSAIFYAILSSHVYLEGTVARREILANLPITAAILLSIELTVRASKNWKFVIIGVFCAISFLYKSPFLYTLAVTILVILANAWLMQEKEGSWKTTIIRTSFILSGFLISIMCVLGYFTSQGLLSRFLLVFTLGQKYVGFLGTPLPLIAIVIAPIYILAINNIFILILSLVGCLRLSRQILIKRINGFQFRLTGTAVLLWFGFSLVAAGIIRRAWPYYNIILLPPLAILVAWEFSQLNIILSRWFGNTGFRNSKILLTLLILLVLMSSGTKNYNQYIHFLRYKSGRESYQAFLTNSFPANAESYIRAEKVAEYITSHTNQGDIVYYWSNDVQLYYLTNLRSAIDMIWPFYAKVTGPPQRILSQQTKYIVVSDSDLVPKPKWLFTELEKYYTLEAVIEGQSVYRYSDG